MVRRLAGGLPAPRKLPFTMNLCSAWGVGTATCCVLSLKGENVVRRLAGGRAGIQEVLLLDTSSEMLARAQRQEVCAS